MLGLRLYGRIWVRIGPKGDEALRMGRGRGANVRTYRCTDGQIPPVFYRTLPPSRPLPKKSPRCPQICSPSGPTHQISRIYHGPFELWVGVGIKSVSPSSIISQSVVDPQQQPSSITVLGIRVLSIKFQSTEPTKSVVLLLPMIGGTISLTIPKLKNMEESLVNPHWLVTTRITPSFPFSKTEQTSNRSLTQNPNAYQNS